MGSQGSTRMTRRRSLDEAEGGEDIYVHHKLKNPRFSTRVSRDVSDAVEKVNWNDMEEVLVKIRPWVKVDGSLNRRVLDRLLGAVLGAVMQQPGSILSNLTSRFSPALQPAHARELIFLLAEIKAVSILKMAKPQPAGLWSKPAPVVLEESDILDCDNQLVIEASVD